jgi:two-component system LytT family response regulator
LLLARAKERLQAPAETQRFLVKNGSTLDVVKFADIDWIEASDYYATLHAGIRTHMLRRTLADLELVLAGCGFQRIHRSAVVNLGRVSALGMRADGEYEVVMVDGQHLRMSRRYRKTVLERLEG